VRIDAYFKMGQNGPKWAKMGPKWAKMEQNLFI